MVFSVLFSRFNISYQPSRLFDKGKKRGRCNIRMLHIAQHDRRGAEIVAPWNLFATFCRTMDGSCIYCMAVSCTLSLRPFFMCSFSFSCCQYLVLDDIPLIKLDQSYFTDNIFVTRVSVSVRLICMTTMRTWMSVHATNDQSAYAQFYRTFMDCLQPNKWTARRTDF
jgi:hypothetical protein